MLVLMLIVLLNLMLSLSLSGGGKRVRRGMQKGEMEMQGARL